jgi:hypothetical protein
MTDRERRELLVEFEAPAKLLGKLHLWKPCMSQHPALVDEKWVQARCGRIERAAIVKVFGIGASGAARCIACFGPPAIQPPKEEKANGKR